MGSSLVCIIIAAVVILLTYRAARRGPHWND